MSLVSLRSSDLWSIGAGVLKPTGPRVVSEYDIVISGRPS